MPTQGFKVLYADDVRGHEDWLRIYASWADSEVYAHPHYVQLYETKDDRAVCAVLESADTTIMFPFILRTLTGTDLGAALNGPAHDLVSPYGYGGAFWWGTAPSESLISQFWSAYDSWAAGVGVVTEFLRFNLFDHSLLTYPGAIERKQDNVIRSLDLDLEDIWMDFEHKVRKNVKKASNAGVTVEMDLDGDRFEDFYRIYNGTMSRRNAGDSYYFDAQFFGSINENLKGNFVYGHAILDGKVISTELVLLSTRTAYSFLGGTDQDYFSYRPNDLLKFEIIKWTKSTSRSNLVLGGGYTAEDGIWRYKRSFAPSGSLPFYTGKRVLDTPAFDELVAARSAAEPSWAPATGYFPAYRS